MKDPFPTKDCKLKNSDIKRDPKGNEARNVGRLIKGQRNVPIQHQIFPGGLLTTLQLYSD